MTGIFATAAGGSPNYVALSSFAAVWSIGVGGNLPVDSAVFLGKSLSLFTSLLTNWLDPRYRIRTSLTSIPTNRFIYMVGLRSAPSKSYRVASDRELLLPHSTHQRAHHALPEIIQPGMAILPLRDGRADASTLGLPVFRLQSL